VSDLDVYGFAIPPKNMIFPHLDGEIYGFGTQKKRFDQYQEHHINYANGQGGRGQNVDVSIYNIVKYFQLCMENNPNMIDSLFTPQFCILHITKVGNMVRDKRHMFLHKGAWPKFKGYAYSQLHKMTTKDPKGKRKETRDKYGFDVKFAYHLVRLLNECEQILVTGTIDLEQDRERLKAIRNGEWTIEQVEEFFTSKEKHLEELYNTSTVLPYEPDEEFIKSFLLECIEMEYGNLDQMIKINVTSEQKALAEIKNILHKYNV
jgi:predicted nucleotidyltransferase